MGNRLNYLFIGEYDEDPEQYTYDMNGAVTYDGNVHCWITGNVLGLQGEMWFEDGSFKENKYLSDGTKTACFHDDCYENGLKYRGSMVYRLEWDEDLQESVERFESAAHPEGRFYAESFTPAGQPVLQSWHYVTDQIGSVLAVVDMDMVANGDEDAAIERNEFGAYGDRVNHSSFPKISGNRNRFNGKEELENTPGPYVDYGARIYSTSARQWLCPDPMADKYPDISPYVFCAGDPVNIVDINGMEAVKYEDKDGNKYIEVNVVVYLEKELEITSEMSEKTKQKTERKNNRIRRRNETRLKTIESSLRQEFSDAIDENGQSISFVFNVIGEQKDNPYVDSVSSSLLDAFNHGIEANTDDRLGTPYYGKAMASIISLASAGSYLGVAAGPLVRLSSWDSKTIAHEVGHTLKLRHPSGGASCGLMHYPPERITPEEVTTIWNKAYEKK